MLKLPQPINDAIFVLGCTVIAVSVLRGLEGIIAALLILALCAAFSAGIRAIWARFYAG